MSSQSYNFETLKVTSPREDVAHVELNRPDKLNTEEDKSKSLLLLCPNFYFICRNRVKQLQLNHTHKIFNNACLY
jgi:hypothetical protein